MRKMTKILLFASFREQLGRESIVWNETPITVGALKGKLKDQYKLSDLEKVMIAVNEEFVENDTVIQDGDTVALIQPVSGG